MDAQIPATCHFCEISTEIKWKCLHCKLFLCRLCCSKIHSKITFTDGHTIVDLKECGQESAIDTLRKVNFQQMACSSHKNRLSVLFCKNCDQVVCATCIVKTHKSHELFELEEMYKMKMTELTDLKTTVDSNLSLFSNEEKELSRCLSDESLVVSKIRAFIHSEQSHLQKVVQSKIKRLLDEIERKWKDKNDASSLLIQQKTNLLKCEASINSALNSSDAMDVFNTVENVIELISNEIEIENESHEQLFQFIATYINIDTIMCDISVSPKVIQSYTTQLKSITSIIYLGNNTVILCSDIDEILEEIVLMNGKSEIVNVLNDIVVSDMAFAKYDNVVLSVGVDIQIFTESKQLTTFLSLDCITLCVHVTKENEILIGAIHVNPRKYEHKEHGVVLRCDRNMNLHQVYGLHDNSNRKHDKASSLSDNKMLRRPSRILKHLEEMVIVDNTDFTTYQGRILAFTPEFDLKWEYTGSSSTFCFCPFDIACTSSDLLLITDIGNKSVHVLNAKGELVSRDFLEGIDMLNPLSLHIDKDNFLWIGCETYVDNEGAQIYCIQI